MLPGPNTFTLEMRPECNCGRRRRREYAALLQSYWNRLCKNGISCVLFKTAYLKCSNANSVCPYFAALYQCVAPTVFLPFLMHIGRVSAPSKHFGACKRHHLFLTGTVVGICGHVAGRIVHSPSIRPSGTGKPRGGISTMPHWSPTQIKPRSPLSCPSMPFTIPPMYCRG